MSSLAELPSSLPFTVSVEVMSQPVTTPNSSELASQLEELSGLASQIVRFSNGLRAAFQSDIPMDGASVWAPLSPALSNARSCLSHLQRINQTPVPPPYCPLFSIRHFYAYCFPQHPTPFNSPRTFIYPYPHYPQYVNSSPP